MSKGTVNKKLITFFVFIIPSLLCLGLYFFVIRKPFTKANSGIFIKLPHYGPATIQPNSADSSFYTLPEFSFINQNNDTVSSVNLNDKFFVLGVVKYNSTQANQLAAQLYTLQKKLKAYKNDFQFIILMTELPNDSLKSLKHFAYEIHADKKIVNLVSPIQADSLLEIFKTPGFIQNLDESMYEDISLILVDKQKQIRGHYKGVYLKETNRMSDEILVLASEYGKLKSTK